jgi:hypothetical protein
MNRDHIKAESSGKTTLTQAKFPAEGGNIDFVRHPRLVTWQTELAPRVREHFLGRRDQPPPERAMLRL